MDQHLAAMQGQMQTTTAQNEGLALGLRQVAAGYRELAGGQAKDSPPAAPLDSPTGQGEPKPAIDPRNPFVGDERFGHWQDVIPPPYVGNTPPPPWTGHRPLQGPPWMEGGPTGFYSPGGQTWADDNAPPAAYLQEQYNVRISGEDYTPYTRMVDGHQEQWVQYSYEAQKFTRVSLGAEIWAPKGPNELTGELGGISTGGLAGLNPPPRIGPWQPITLPQIASLSAANPTTPYYMPDGCGGQFKFVNGTATGGVMAPPPVLPSMIAGP
jgi:hypothetical protein